MKFCSVVTFYASQGGSNADFFRLDSIVARLSELPARCVIEKNVVFSPETICQAFICSGYNIPIVNNSGLREAVG